MYLFLSLIAVVFAIVGFVKPEILIWHTNPSRWKVFGYFILIFSVSLIFLETPQTKQTSKDKPAVAKLMEPEKSIDETEGKSKLKEKESSPISNIDMDENTKAAKNILKYYLHAIKRGEFEQAVYKTTDTWRNRQDVKLLANKLKNQYYQKIHFYKIEKIRQNGDVLKSFKVSLKIQGDSKNYIMTPNVICESGPRNPDINGSWGVNPISAMITIE